VRLEALHDEMARHAKVVGADHLPILRRSCKRRPPSRAMGNRSGT
jgi:hypothetical protein